MLLNINKNVPFFLFHMANFFSPPDSDRLAQQWLYEYNACHMIHIQSTFFCLFHPFYGMLAEKSFQWKCGNGRSARQKVIKCLQICIKRRIKNKKYNRTRNEPKYIWTTPHALFGETATHTWTQNCSTHATDQKKTNLFTFSPKKCMESRTHKNLWQRTIEKA